MRRELPLMWIARYSGQPKSDVRQPWAWLFEIKPGPYTIRTKPPLGSCPGSAQGQKCIGGCAAWSGVGTRRARLGVVASCRLCGRGRYVNVEIPGVPGHTPTVRMPSMPKPDKNSGNTASWIIADSDLGRGPVQYRELCEVRRGSSADGPPRPVGGRTRAAGLSDVDKPFERGVGAAPFTPDNIFETERRSGKKWRSPGRWRGHA